MSSLLASMIIAAILRSAPTVQVIADDALPQSMRAARYLHEDQLLFDLIVNDDADTLVAVVELRDAYRTYELDVAIRQHDGSSSSVWSAGTISLAARQGEPLPQFRRIVLRHAVPGAQFTSCSLLEVEDRRVIRSTTGSVTLARTIDVR